MTGILKSIFNQFV